MNLKLHPYDPTEDMRARAMAAVQKIATEERGVLEAEIAAVTPPKPAARKCMRPDCTTRFVSEMDHKLYCSGKCLNVEKVRRFRGRQGQRDG